MNISKKNTDSCFPAIICTLLVIFLFAFANQEKREDSIIPRASFHPFVETCYNTQAVIPATTDLPVCASFTDDNHIILAQTSQSNASTNHFIDITFRVAQEKHILIKPILNKVLRRLIFPNPDPNDFIAIG